DAHHAPPKRSVLILAAGCPSPTSASATCSTNPVGPHTYTVGSRSGPHTASRSASSSSRPIAPSQPSGAARGKRQLSPPPPPPPRGRSSWQYSGSSERRRE